MGDAIRIALLGCGVVGSQVVRLLDEQADDLAQAGLRLLERVVEVAAHLDPQRRPGRCVGTECLEVAEVLG